MITCFIWLEDTKLSELPEPLEVRKTKKNTSHPVAPVYFEGGHPDTGF